MSDIPSTEFDEEFELTTGTDTLIGSGGNDLILGEISGSEDSGLNTLNGSDLIKGKAGIDTFRLAASGDDLTIGNFTLKSTEVFEVRSQADSLDVNLAFSTGVDTLWFNNNFGGSTQFSAVQEGADIVVTGGDADLYVDYANGVAVDTQSVLVDGADSWLGVNYDDENFMIPNVAIQSQGTASDLSLEVYGQKNWTITGDADLDIWENGDSALWSIDSTAFLGDLYLVGDMGNGGAVDPVTAKTGAGADSLVLDGDGSDAIVKAGNSGDYVDVEGFGDLVLRLGKGHDNAYVEVSGDVTLGAGNGKDTVSVYTDGGNLDADMGTDSKADNLYMEWVDGTADVLMGGGDDYLYGSVGNDLTADLGDGDNFMYTYSDGDTTVTALGGDDYAYIYTADDLKADFGHGDNEIYLDVDNNYSEIGDSVFAADIKTRSGDDFVRADVDGNLKAALGGGDDVIGVSNVDGYLDVSLAAGNDQIRTGWRGISEDDKVDGGDGDDVLFGRTLGQFNGEDDFDMVSGIEAVSVLDDSSVNVEFNGEDTGANAAGIGHYMFEMDAWAGDGSIESNYDLNEMAGGVMLDIAVRSDYLSYFNLDLEAGAADKSADINFFAEGYTTFRDVEISNTETLNITLTDVDTDDSGGVEHVTFGEDNTFMADDVLETITLSGDASISIEGVVAESLSMVDASGMSESVSLGFVFGPVGLVDVADDFTFLGGSGNDSLFAVDDDTSYTVDSGEGDDYVIVMNSEDDSISTGGGDDIAFSGAGKDSIYLGAGDDLAVFLEGELTSADVLEGGDGFDTVAMWEGSLNEDDAFFYQWDGVENLNLAEGDDNITLHSIANDSGLEQIDLSRGGNDVVTVGEGFESPLTVVLGDTAGDTIKVQAKDSEIALTITGGEAVFTDDEFLRAGSGTEDKIVMTATASNAVFGENVRGFESVIVMRDGATDVSITTHEKNVSSGARLLVDASDLVGDPNMPGDPDFYGHAPGDLTFDGVAETNGAFDVIGGQGNDTITTGTKADTVNGGLGDDTIVTGAGDDTVDGGAGDDDITTDGGADTITAGDGDDTIVSGKGIDMIDAGDGDDTISADNGADTVDAGAGEDSIDGGKGADTLSGGDDTDTDTFYYDALTDSQWDAFDVITDFTSGEDVIDLSGVGAVVFKGNATDPTDLTNKLAGDGTIEAIFEIQTNTLWVDMDGDGAITTADLRIELTGVESMVEGDVGLLMPI